MKNKSIHIVSAILFSLLFSMSLSSQNSTTTLSLLKGKKWELLLPPEKQYRFTGVFSNDSLVSTYTYNGTNISSNALYYLSDSIDYNFDSTRIGQCQNGKYIVIKYIKSNKVDIMEIISLSSIFAEFQDIANRELELKYQDK